MGALPTREQIRAEQDALPGLGEMQAIRRIQAREIIRRDMDPRLGTRDAWKVMEPVSRDLRAIEVRYGHMSDEYAAKLGELDALRREDFNRSFFRKMGVEL